MKPSVQYIESYLAELQKTVANLPADLIDQIVDTLLACAERGNRVFMFGNGGSASTASHFACDLSKNTIVPGAPRFKVFALTDNVELLTAWANDTSYANVFAGQLEALVDPGDVAIGISCSGNSPNVLNGVEMARSRGATIIGMTGDKGGRLPSMSDLCIKTTSPFIEQQENIHLALEHCICMTIRTEYQKKYVPVV